MASIWLVVAYAFATLGVARVLNMLFPAVMSETQSWLIIVGAMTLGGVVIGLIRLLTGK